MRKSGGLIALIAGILGLIAATITLLIGGIGSNFNAYAGDTIIGLGWGGVFICFLIIVLGAVAMNAKNFIPGLLIIIASVFGAIYGGTLVAVLMMLALVGGVLACMSNGELETTEGSFETTKSNRDSLIKVICLAGLILMVILYISKSNQHNVETPTAITILEDTPSMAANSSETSLAVQHAPHIEITLPETVEPSTEIPVNGSATETLPPTETSESPVQNMSFNDLYLDYSNLVGQKVKVNGHFLPYGDLGSLSESAISATTLYVNIGGLSRENRKLLLDNCSSGCNVELEGVVGSVQFLKGITVTNLYKITTN